MVLRYSAHIKPRKTIKTIKPDNITHKHNMTLIVNRPPGTLVAYTGRPVGQRDVTQTTLGKKRKKRRLLVLSAVLVEEASFADNRLKL